MTMATKKPTIAPRPLKSAEDFVNGAAQNLEAAEDLAVEEPAAKKEKEKKTQVPLLILPSLLEALDAHLEDQGTGISRSAWICQAIKKQIEAQS